MDPGTVPYSSLMRLANSWACASSSATSPASDWTISCARTPSAGGRRSTTVHYPLFAEVGADRFVAYHARHSDRTTLVVLPAMTVELATSVWLVVDQPQGTSAALVLAGLALAIFTWVATFLLVVPRHRDLGAGLDPVAVRRLGRASWVRTAAWTMHGVVVAVLLSQAA